MRKFIKNAIVTLSILILGVTIGKATTPQNIKVVEAQNEQKNVTISQIVTKSNNEWYLNTGSYAIELSDGSWALIDNENNRYIFQPVSMGDWDYTCENMEQLKKCIQNYLVINN